MVVVCLSVCLLATLCKNFRTDLHEIFKKEQIDDRQTTDGRAIAYNERELIEREHEFTFAKNGPK